VNYIVPRRLHRTSSRAKHKPDASNASCADPKRIREDCCGNNAADDETEHLDARESDDVADDHCDADDDSNTNQPAYTGHCTPVDVLRNALFDVLDNVHRISLVRTLYHTALDSHET